jgi:predicted transcriptional regulator
MRTTIRLSEDLLRQLKKMALEQKRTLSSLLEEAAREKLARRRRTPAGQVVRMQTFRGRGVQPGVDLDDSASLMDLLEK